MGRLKKVIKAALLSYGLHCVMGDHHPYYEVQVTLVDTEDEKRQITWGMDPDEAERMGHGLIEYAKKTRSHNYALEAGRFKNDGGETDVHTEHCCVRHGCKYADDACTVTTRQKPQSFTCEVCDDL